MKKLGIVVSFLIFYFSSNAQIPLSEGCDLLFKGVKSKLNNYDKNLIFDRLEFAIAPDKKSFISIYDLDKKVPFEVFIYPTDMNKDGEEEVFVVYGNTTTSGAAGSSVIVFIKDAGGIYRGHLGFPGIVSLISSIKKGFSDLLIGGPGTVFPVWRWDGKTYNFYKKITERELQYFKIIPVEEASKRYQDTLN